MDFFAFAIAYIVLASLFFAAIKYLQYRKKKKEEEQKKHKPIPRISK